LIALSGLEEQPFQASPLATPWQAGFDERPAMRDFKPKAKRSFSEALLERRAL